MDMLWFRLLIPVFSRPCSLHFIFTNNPLLILTLPLINILLIKFQVYVNYIYVVCITDSIISLVLIKREVLDRNLLNREFWCDRFCTHCSMGVSRWAKNICFYYLYFVRHHVENLRMSITMARGDWRWVVVHPCLPLNPPLSTACFEYLLFMSVI